MIKISSGQSIRLPSAAQALTRWSSRRYAAIAGSTIAIAAAVLGPSIGANASTNRPLEGARTSAVSPASAPNCDNGQKITLSVWSYYATPGQINALKEQDALFKTVCPNVTVKQVLIPGDELDTKLLGTATTHSGPDVLLNNVIVDFPELQRAGVMYNLTKFWDAYPHKTQYPESAVWKAPSGQIYTVMSYTNLIGLWYNKSILNKYHLTVPKTISQFESDMKTVVAGGEYGGLAEAGAPTIDGMWLFMPLLLSDNVGLCNLHGPKVTAAFTEVSDWVKEKLIPSSTAIWTQNDSWQEFSTGKFAFGILGNWNLGAAKSDLQFPYGTARFPANDSTGKSVVYPGGEGLAIGAYTKYPTVAWQYLETSWLSKAGNLANFVSSGQLPLRRDVSTTPQVESDTLAQPFVQAADNSATWTANPQIAAMQTGVGQAVSGDIAGQLSPSAAAAQAEAAVATAIKAGGGKC